MLPLPSPLYRSCARKGCWGPGGTGRWTMRAGWWSGWSTRVQAERAWMGHAVWGRTTAPGASAGLAPVTTSGTTGRTWKSNSPTPPLWACTLTNLPASLSFSWWRERVRRRCAWYTSSKPTSKRSFYLGSGLAQSRSACCGKRISNMTQQ